MLPQRDFNDDSLGVHQWHNFMTRKIYECNLIVKTLSNQLRINCWSDLYYFESSVTHHSIWQNRRTVTWHSTDSLSFTPTEQINWEQSIIQVYKFAMDNILWLNHLSGFHLPRPRGWFHQTYEIFPLLSHAACPIATTDTQKKSEQHRRYLQNRYKR